MVSIKLVHCVLFSARARPLSMQTWPLDLGCLGLAIVIWGLVVIIERKQRL